MEDAPDPPREAHPDLRAQDLDEARRRLDAMAEAAAAFAHDLKNPLSAVLLGVQRLARLADPARQAQARELAARLERSIQGASRLADGHADLAKLQAGRLQLEPSRLPCAAILLRAIEPLQQGAAERRQELRVDLAHDLPEVRWDGQRIAQALDHALGTALRLSPEGASVACAARPDGRDVVIEVVVERPASAPSPAAQPGSAPPAPPRRIRGSGLIVARGLVEAHGGRVELDDGPDRTTLRLILPAHPASAPRP